MSPNNDPDILRIALVGYGRMGREIERLAADNGAEIAARYSAATPLDEGSAADFDVAIEFTRPEAAVGNIERIVRWGKPVVVGTTGWLDEIETVRRAVEEHGGRVVYGSNFSIGVNVFFKLARLAAGLINGQSMYDAAVHEIHHVRKADSPSGTALQAARILLEELDRKSEILSGPAMGRIDPAQLHVSSQRLGETVGTHIVSFDSEADTIELAHRAKNRAGFAHGALWAARWITGREPGLYRFEEIV
jgi:4-hydroxy-tetrahydrodipicolinate reductase